MTTRIAHLGPEGTFTHAAALAFAGEVPDGVTLAVPTVADVVAAVESGRADRGVVAVENTVEGFVAASLDALLATDVVAVATTTLPIAFDAFVRPGADRAALTEVTAHPHGLAQCQAFAARRGLAPVPAASNAAACRDVGPHQVALGPRACGPLYGLETLEEDVQDFGGARTRFLLLAPRDAAAALVRGEVPDAGPRRTMLAVTPRVAGPGVLARMLEAFRAHGINLSSLITRPLKVTGLYVFVLTLDGAASEPGVRAALGDLLAAGDLVKTLGVFTAGDAAEPLDLEHVPSGSVDGGAPAAAQDRALLW